MMPDSPIAQTNAAESAENERSGLLKACAVALIAGVAIGVVGAYFRAGLAWLGARHIQLVEWAQQWPLLGWLLPVAVGALAAGVARLLVRGHPLASGSGVQHVEAVMRNEAPVASFWIVPIKFFGGILGIGTGLALGREGPTVQMGATIGAFVARALRCAQGVIRDVQAALGGAGLAVAFNAPVGGAVFVFEEVAHAFRLRLTLVTMIATAAAIGVSRMILGNRPDFLVDGVTPGAHWALGAYFVFGLLLGLLGVLYNKLTVLGLRAADSMRRWPPEARAALVGGIVGLVAWFAPHLVGGGDFASQQILNGGLPLGALFIIFAVRWVLGPLSYSVGTPGGLFAPLLLVGAVLGAIFAGVFNALAPEVLALSPIAFAIVGMTGFFTGVVRAPFTGLILVVEMTATTTLMVPLLVACFAAMLGATLARGAPIYDTLRERMLDGFKNAPGKNREP